MNADILRQRRNLISTSIGLSIYQVAGEKLEKGSAIFGTFKIENPDFVIYLAWCSLAYFLWRYWLYAKSLKQHISETLNKNKLYADKNLYLYDFQTSLANMKGYRKLATKIFKESSSEEEIERLLDRRPELTPTLVRGFFNRKLDYSYFSPTSKIGAQGSEGIEVNVSFLIIFPYELSAQIIAIFTEKTYSNFVLPYLFAFIPVLIFFLKPYF